MARPQEFDTAEVLDNALNAFWDKGYEATSISDLVRATGLSRSSLYGSFGNKHALFLEAFDLYRVMRKRDMDRVLQKGTADEKIRAFLHMVISEAQDPNHGTGCMSMHQTVELAPRDPDVQRRVDRDFRTVEDALTAVIVEGQADGTLATRYAPRNAARLIVTAFPGMQLVARVSTRPELVEDAVEQLIAMLR